MWRSIPGSMLALAGLLTIVLVLSSPSHAITIPLFEFRIGSYVGDGKPINCRQGERFLRRRGFSSIRRIDCRGRYYIYQGSRRGSRYSITVRARDGRIVDFRRTLR